MIGKKKLSDVRAEVETLLSKLPGRSARAWIEKEIKTARTSEERDVETLEMLCAALDRQVRKKRQASRRGAQRKPSAAKLSRTS